MAILNEWGSGNDSARKNPNLILTMQGLQVNDAHGKNLKEVLVEGAASERGFELSRRHRLALAKIEPCREAFLVTSLNSFVQKLDLGHDSLVPTLKPW